MSKRELKSLQTELCVSSRTRSGELVKSRNTVGMAETDNLRAELEAARSTLEDKEKELRLVVEQAKAETENLRVELETALEDKEKMISELYAKLEELEESTDTHASDLEQQLHDSKLHSELESLRSLERLA